MQNRIETWLSYWIARPVSWAIYGLCIAVMFVYSAGIRGIIWLRQRWVAWRSRRNAGDKAKAQSPFSTPPNVRGGAKRRAA